jgi:hypothetical protein
MMPAEGVSRLALSSTARLRIVVVPAVIGVQVKLQVSRPSAGCHVDPLSVETSTPPTTPPPLSLAVPEIVVGKPHVNVTPDEGEDMIEVGAV